MSKNGPPIRWPREPQGTPRKKFAEAYDGIYPRPDEIMEWQAKRDAMIYSPEGLATGWEMMTETDAARTEVVRATDQIEVFDLAEDMKNGTQKRDVEWWIGEIMTGIMLGDLAPIFRPYSDGAAQHRDDLVPTQRLDENGQFLPEAEGKPTKGDWLWPIDREWISDAWANHRSILSDERPTVDDMSRWPTGGYRLKCDGYDWVAVFLYPIRIDRAAAEAWTKARDVYLSETQGAPAKPKASPKPRGRNSIYKPRFMAEIKRRVDGGELTLQRVNGEIENMAYIARQLLEWHADAYPASNAPVESTVREYIRTHLRKNQ